MPTYHRHYLLFWSIGAILIVSVILVVSSQLDPERRAFVSICEGLVAQVIDGDATQFDYMATRCPASMLTDAEATAGKMR